MIDFMKNASNVYSTAKYIVSQNIRIVVDKNNIHYSTTLDRFYKRTKQRDKEYCKYFLTDNVVSGGRISCDVTKRIYME